MNETKGLYIKLKRIHFCFTLKYTLMPCIIRYYNMAFQIKGQCISKRQMCSSQFQKKQETNFVKLSKYNHHETLPRIKKEETSQN
jgi:hypothetical protein